jgi:hypothetical protein
VAAAAARHTQSPTATPPTAGRQSPGGPRPRFAGERGLGRGEGNGRGESRLERERRIEQFREDHANLRSKGYSEDAAAREAERAQRSGERPMPSRRYQLLSGAQR